MRNLCPKCDEIMLPAGRDYTYEVYECQECGHEALIDEDGEVAIDYQRAWGKLREWISDPSMPINTSYYTIKQKMAEILKERS